MRIARQLATTAALLPACMDVLAHEGHGSIGSHWHATDTWGFVCVAFLAGLALWASRDK